MRNAYPLYDRRFSVTAWYGDEMVGHALFSPVRLRLMGETVRALVVLPNFQRQGIGGHCLVTGMM